MPIDCSEPLPACLLERSPFELQATMVQTLCRMADAEAANSGGSATSNSAGVTNQWTPTDDADLLGAVRVFSISGYAEIDGYVHIFDSATLPANGSTPLLSVKVLADQNYSVDWPGGRAFATGLAVAHSSTAATLTLVVTDDITVDAVFNPA